MDDQPAEKSPLEYITIAKVGAIPTGEGRSFSVGNRMVALFYVDGEYWAIDDFCPHMGASLADGFVEDGTVSCPWHAWRFRVCDGTWCDNPKIKTDSFPVRIQGEEIQVAIPTPSADEESSQQTSSDQSAANLSPPSSDQTSSDQTSSDQTSSSQPPPDQR